MHPAAHGEHHHLHPAADHGWQGRKLATNPAFPKGASSPDGSLWVNVTPEGKLVAYDLTRDALFEMPNSRTLTQGGKSTTLPVVHRGEIRWIDNRIALALDAGRWIKAQRGAVAIIDFNAGQVRLVGEASPEKVDLLGDNAYSFKELLPGGYVDLVQQSYSAVPSHR